MNTLWRRKAERPAWLEHYAKYMMLPRAPQRPALGWCRVENPQMARILELALPERCRSGGGHVGECRQLPAAFHSPVEGVGLRAVLEFAFLKAGSIYPSVKWLLSVDLTLQTRAALVVAIRDVVGLSRAEFEAEVALCLLAE